MLFSPCSRWFIFAQILEPITLSPHSVRPRRCATRSAIFGSSTARSDSTKNSLVLTRSNRDHVLCVLTRVVGKAPLALPVSQTSNCRCCHALFSVTLLKLLEEMEASNAMMKSDDKALTSSGENNKRSRSENRDPIDNEKKLSKKRARRKAGDSSSSTSSSSSSSTSAASTSSSISLVASADSYATEPAAVSVINSSSLSSSSAGTVMGSAPPTTTAPASPAIPLVLPDEFSYDLAQHAPLIGRFYTNFIYEVNER